MILNVILPIFFLYFSPVLDKIAYRKYPPPKKINYCMIVSFVKMGTVKAFLYLGHK